MANQTEENKHLFKASSIMNRSVTAQSRDSQGSQQEVVKF